MLAIYNGFVDVLLSVTVFTTPTPELRTEPKFMLTGLNVRAEFPIAPDAEEVLTLPVKVMVAELAVAPLAAVT